MADFHVSFSINPNTHTRTHTHTPFITKVIILNKSEINGSDMLFFFHWVIKTLYLTHFMDFQGKMRATILLTAENVSQLGILASYNSCG